MTGRSRGEPRKEDNGVLQEPSWLRRVSKWCSYQLPTLRLRALHESPSPGNGEWGHHIHIKLDQSA